MTPVEKAIGEVTELFPLVDAATVEDFIRRRDDGIVWLNRFAPWVTTVDVEDLAVDSASQCVLGQVFGNFDYAVHVARFLTLDEAYDRLFTLCRPGASDRPDDKVRAQQWQAATWLWRDAIQRLETRCPTPPRSLPTP